MKHFKITVAWLTVLALTFTSCSKEESDTINGEKDTVQLTFGAMLDAFNNQNKQATWAECREDAVPAYVWVGISTDEAGNDFIPGGNEDNLIEVGLKNNNGSWETTYSDDLELPADTYYLQHFIVYDAGGQVLWVAPREGGAFASEVGDALPQAINLVGGTKPYIAVDVLCFIPREEEAYGYPFFDFDVVEVENSYCLFVNYCYDEDGREYPAHFSVEVWSDTWDGVEEVSLSNNMNSISMEGGNPAATVLCLALPDLGDDTYYARVTVRNHALLPYVTDPEVDYFDFTITQADIEAQELEVPAYEHVRFNCQPPYGEPTCEPGTVVGDTNGDCIVDCQDTNSCEPNDPCPGINPDLDTNGDCVIDCRDTNTCESQGCGDTAFMYGDYILADHYNGNNWGWGLLIDGVGVDADEEFYDEENERWVLPFWAGAGQNDTNKGWRAGDVILELDEDGEQIHVTIDLYDGVTVGDTHFWFNDDNQWPEKRSPGDFDLHKGTDLLSYSFPVDGEGPYTLIVHAGQVCHEDF